MCGDPLGVRRSKLRCARCAGARGGPDGDRRWVRRASDSRSRSTISTPTAARFAAARSRQRRESSCASGWSGSLVSQPRSRSRGAPGGGSWSKNSRPPGSRPTSPSRRTPLRCGGRRSGPRPTSSTLRHLRRAAARRLDPRVVDPSRPCPRGSHQGPSLQDARRSTHRAGSSGSTPSCSTRAPHPSPALLTAEGRLQLNAAELSPAGREAVDVALHMIDAITAASEPLRDEIAAIARRQPGCRALAGPLRHRRACTSVAIWAELGDCRRFSSSDDAVRHTGLDITVHSSDNKRARGQLARQGPTGAALGAVRGRQVRRQAQLSRPRLLPRGPSIASAPTGPPCRSPANSPAAATTPCAPSATTPSPHHRTAEARSVRQALHTMICGLLPQCSCRQSHAPDGPHRTSGRTLTTGLLPSTITCRSPNTAHRDKAERPARPNQASCTRRHQRSRPPDDLTRPDTPRRRPACAGPRRRQGRSSSLRCGRSTLTSTPVRRDTPASEDAPHHSPLTPAPHTDKEHRALRGPASDAGRC